MMTPHPILLYLWRNVISVEGEKNNNGLKERSNEVKRKLKYSIQVKLAGDRTVVPSPAAGQVHSKLHVSPVPVF